MIKEKNLFVLYTVRTDPFLPEIITGVLWQTGITGIVEENDSIKVYADDNTDGLRLAEILGRLQKENVIRNFDIISETFENQNWNQVWERSREIIKVTDRIIIKPSFKNFNPGNNQIVLTIDPKMSFGTGDHPTTKLMLSLLEKYVHQNFKVLDAGSGTGILAVASIKLGASKAIALDNDETCYENCKENCLLNNVGDFVEIISGEMSDVVENEFDIVAANIQKNVLLDIAHQIRLKIKNNGKVILSGLLIEDQNAVEERYHSLGFHTIEVDQMNEWIAIVFGLK